MYRFLTSFILFFFSDSESAHRLAVSLLKIMGVRPLSDFARALTKVQDPALKTSVCGINFQNPVGLAGGFDKEGEALHGIEALGFGFVEAGTITRYAQEGNPRPRLFRLERDRALINRMGFNNHGADALKMRLEKARKLRIPIGISIGKSKITELAKAKDDYLYSFKTLYPYADYFAVNVSSPNTPGLRKLQDKEHLMEIIGALCDYRRSEKIHKPILVKIAPDLTYEAIDEVLDVIAHHCIEGIIATNTTLERKWITSNIDEAGGLSGRPLREKSTEIIRYIHRKNPSLPIIGVGGIFDARDVFEKIAAGARLVQIYTGFIYNGPFAVRRINRGLARILKNEGISSIKDAVGISAK
jgi:dihydroorotate dehydrogenase